MASENFSEKQSRPVDENPYPVSLSAKEPVKFFEAETAMEVMIVSALDHNNTVSKKHFEQVFKELDKVARETSLPKNMQLSVNQLLQQFHSAAVQENERVKLNIEKMRAILHAFQKI